MNSQLLPKTLHVAHQIYAKQWKNHWLLPFFLWQIIARRAAPTRTTTTNRFHRNAQVIRNKSVKRGQSHEFNKNKNSFRTQPKIETGWIIIWIQTNSLVCCFFIIVIFVCQRNECYQRNYEQTILNLKEIRNAKTRILNSLSWSEIKSRFVFMKYSNKTEERPHFYTIEMRLNEKQHTEQGAPGKMLKQQTKSQLRHSLGANLFASLW